MPDQQLVLLFEPKGGEHQHTDILVRAGFRVASVATEKVDIGHLLEQRPAVVAAEIDGSGSAAPALAGRVIRLSAPARYGLAVALALAAILVRLALDPVWGIRFTFTMLFPAVVVSAWLGGFGPGIATTLLCAVAAAYFWIE